MLRCVVRAGHDRDRPNSYTTLCRPDILSISNGIDYSNDDSFAKRDPDTLGDGISGA